MRQRVIIVGAGIAGLTTAYELSRTRRARREWDVEVVEMGHMIGGRLASAHRPEASGRNEEHGLHVWFGFYDNTLRLAEQVWDEWDKPANCPWRTIWDGLRPIHASDHGLTDGERYVVRRVLHARNSDWPGDGEARSWAGRVTGWVDALHTIPLSALSMLLDRPDAPVRLPGPVRTALWPTPAQHAAIRNADRIVTPVLERISKLVAPSTPEQRREGGRRVERALARIHRATVAGALEVAAADAGARALAHALDLLLATARGVASPEHGIAEDADLDRISRWELCDWLLHHGACRETIEQSAFVEALYDMPFAYVGGDRSRRVIEAGTAMRFALRILADYKHAVAYLLAAGAGETLVAPLYDLLRRRGVRFRPFLRLVRTDVDRDTRRIRRLVFLRTARVRGEYQPLVERNGLVGFRADPDWSQLEDGDRLRARGVDFYSRFSDRGEDREVVLEVDRDFDDVVLALPLGSIVPDGDGFSPVAGWIDAHPAAQKCFERLHLVPTVAAQVWFHEPARAVGFDGRAIVSWAPPYSVLCDMTPVIEHESWAPPVPASCAYLCGAWPLTAPHARSTDRDAKAHDLATARAALASQLLRHGSSLPGSGEAPAGTIRSDYVRVNVEPWELADLALPGANEVRLEATDSGLSNVALAGAWVRTAMNTTSVEAAVSSGIAAARALGADTQPVLGEAWLRKPSPRPVLPGRRRPAPQGRSEAALDVDR